MKVVFVGDHASLRFWQRWYFSFLGHLLVYGLIDVEQGGHLTLKNFTFRFWKVYGKRMKAAYDRGYRQGCEDGVAKHTADAINGRAESAMEIN